MLEGKGPIVNGTLVSTSIHGSPHSRSSCWMTSPPLRSSFIKTIVPRFAGMSASVPAQIASAQRIEATSSQHPVQSCGGVCSVSWLVRWSLWNNSKNNFFVVLVAVIRGYLNSSDVIIVQWLIGEVLSDLRCYLVSTT